MIKFARRCLPSSPLARRRLPPSKSSDRQECPIKIDNGPPPFRLELRLPFSMSFSGGGGGPDHGRSILSRNFVSQPHSFLHEGVWTLDNALDRVHDKCGLLEDCIKEATGHSSSRHNPVSNEDHPKLVARDSAPRGGPFPASLSVLAFIQ